MYRLSPSALKKFQDCPCCFYLEKKLEMTLPRGIMSSLPTAIDGILKKHFDAKRVYTQRLPAELVCPQLEGFTLYHDVTKLNKMRHWKSGLKLTSKKWELFGAIDDLLFNLETGRYAALDYKTKGKKADIEYCTKYNQTQLDCYSLMFEGNDMPPADFGGCVYFSADRYIDHDIEEDGIGIFQFDVEVITIPVSTIRARALLDRAVECLESPIEPEHSNECELGTFLKARALQRTA